MEITDKINYVLGKTVVYMLLIIYPFVMHNKLNDVTLTRFFFFIIVSYVGFLVLCINSLASFILKRVSDKKNMMMTRLILLILRKVRIMLKVRA